MLNLASEPATFRLPGDGGRVMLSTELDRAGETVGGAAAVRPGEGIVMQID